MKRPAIGESAFILADGRKFGTRGWNLFVGEKETQRGVPFPKMRGPAEEKAVSIETEEVAEWNRIFQSNAGDRLTYFYLNVFNYIRLFTSSVISLFFLQFCTRSIFWSKQGVFDHSRNSSAKCVETVSISLLSLESRRYFKNCRKLVDNLRAIKISRNFIPACIVGGRENHYVRWSNNFNLIYLLQNIIRRSTNFSVNHSS